MANPTAARPINAGLKKLASRPSCVAHWQASKMAMASKNKLNISRRTTPEMGAADAVTAAGAGDGVCVCCAPHE
jgi:hypothetical protein